MLKNYLKVALRNLTRNKLYTTINVFGLAIGIAGCILIMLFVQHEWSFDNFHPHADHIYRVIKIEKKADGEKHASAFMPMPCAPALLAEFPEIKAAVRFHTGSSIVTYGEKTFSIGLVFADPAVFAVFNFALLQGNPVTALAQPNSVVMTERMAKKFFGAENPIGKSLTINIRDKTEDFVVTAVAQDIPDNSSIQFQRGQTEGRLNKDADTVQLRFQSLRNVYLGSVDLSSPENESNPIYSYILSGIAGFVLLIACINFMTLAIGRSSNRAKEVGMRKVLGAVRVQLMKQFWGEALLLSLLAFALGIGLAELFLPTFNQFASKNLTLGSFFHGWFFLGLLGLWLIVGLMAGSYPSFFLSRFQPVSVLKGATKLGGKNFFTQGLVVFQFGLAIFLIVAALVMSAQLKFVVSKNLGYNAEQVVIIPMYTDKGEELVTRFKTKLAGQPSVVNISGTSGAFTHGYDINGFEHNSKNRRAYVYRVDPAFLETLGIQLREGRNFLAESGPDARQAIIVNETLTHDFEWQPPFVGKRLTGWDEKRLPGGPEVIGVVKDFHFRSLHEEIAPAILFMDPEWTLNEILVRISPINMAQTVALLEKTWKEVAPNRPFDFSFLDDEVEQQYRLEQRWGKIVNSSTIFAIMLACLGLFGLSTLAATNRTKEIGIRKVLGASIANVTGLISKDFIKLVLIANIIAWPAAYWVMNKLLQNYAYRISLGPEFFILATAFALTIAFLTVSFQAIKAALANPVEALRYE